MSLFVNQFMHSARPRAQEEETVNFSIVFTSIFRQLVVDIVSEENMKMGHLPTDVYMQLQKAKLQNSNQIKTRSGKSVFKLRDQNL